jgi:ureidoacrylate peracid hydrolase
MTAITVDYKSIYGDWGYNKGFPINPATSALLIVDMQPMALFPDANNYMQAYSQLMPVDLTYFVQRVRTLTVPNIQRLLEFFRKSRLRVVHIWTAAETEDFSDMPPSKARWLRTMQEKTGMDIYKAWQPEVKIMPECAPREHEIVVLKKTGSAFNQTLLNFYLQNMGIETLVICGGNTNGCVFETSVFSSELGYNNILVSDASHAFHPDLQAEAEEIYRVHYGLVWMTDEVIREYGARLEGAA